MPTSTHNIAEFYGGPRDGETIEIQAGDVTTFDFPVDPGRYLYDDKASKAMCRDILMWSQLKLKQTPKVNKP